MTSRDVVNVVQKRLRKIKVGHAGTLDPLAQGVLVLGVGPAARLVPFVQQYRKRYVGTFRLGAYSESGDIETELLEPTGMPVPTREQLEAAAGGLVGRIEQTPPAYSAIHIDGKRAYERVRAGEVFEMPTRQVDVYGMKVLRYEFPEVELDVTCGSGTYIRTLGIDLAREVGTVAVMTHLRRLSIGPFSLDQSVSIDRLRQDDLADLLLPPRLAVLELPRVMIEEEASRRLGHGLGIDLEAEDARGNPVVTDWQEGDQAAALTEQLELRAIVCRKRSAWFPYRVFPLTEH